MAEFDFSKLKFSDLERLPDENDVDMLFRLMDKAIIGGVYHLTVREISLIIPDFGEGMEKHFSVTDEQVAAMQDEWRIKFATPENHQQQPD